MIITVKHNFETAHRLPFLQGKCENIHGHSWQVEWMFDFPMDENGLTYEYGALKKDLRGWVDKYLDHGVMLGNRDYLLKAFFEARSKVFVFGSGLPTDLPRPDQFDTEAWYTARPWPTVEAVAEMLGNKAQDFVPDNNCVQVRVQETAVNAAMWERNEYAGS